MKQLFGTNPWNSTIKHGFYGDFSFLDSQTNFINVFGKNPLLLGRKPENSDDTALTKSQLKQLVDKCKLKIFLHQTKTEYVGETLIQNGKNIIAVCKEISALRQDELTKNGVNCISPSILSNKFTQLVTNLPSDAKLWTITLCTTFMSALNKDLVESMTEDTTF